MAELIILVLVAVAIYMWLGRRLVAGRALHRNFPLSCKKGELTCHFPADFDPLYADALHRHCQSIHGLYAKRLPSDVIPHHVYFHSRRHIFKPAPARGPRNPHSRRYVEADSSAADWHGSYTRGLLRSLEPASSMRKPFVLEGFAACCATGLDGFVEIDTFARHYLQEETEFNPLHLVNLGAAEFYRPGTYIPCSKLSASLVRAMLNDYGLERFWAYWQSETDFCDSLGEPIDQFLQRWRERLNRLDSLPPASRMLYLSEKAGHNFVASQKHFLGLGQVERHLLAGDLPAAEQATQELEALEADPRIADFVGLCLLELFVDLGLYARAVEVSEWMSILVAERPPLRVGYNLWRGLAFLGLDDTQHAMEHFSHACLPEDEVGADLSTMARLFIKLSQAADAKPTELKVLVSRRPASEPVGEGRLAQLAETGDGVSEIHYLIGSIRFGQGQFRSARQHIERCLEAHEPLASWAWTQLAQLDILEGRHDHLERLVHKPPKQMTGQTHQTFWVAHWLVTGQIWQESGTA